VNSLAPFVTRLRDSVTTRGLVTFYLANGGGQHIQDDLRSIRLIDFDVLIAHPPCTHLAVSGARWWAGKEKEQAESIAFVSWIRKCAPWMFAIENPIGALSRHWRKPDQIIQPWQFGHGETKATCLWLRGLPLLRPTNVVPGRMNRVHRESPGADRWARRSRTLSGIARAMAEQFIPMGGSPGQQSAHCRSL
jgi:site-specific DNA-cytosine methylase